MSPEDKVVIPGFDLEKLLSEGGPDYLERIKLIGQKMADCLLRINKGLEQDKLMILMDVNENYFWTEDGKFDNDTFDKMSVDMGELSVHRVGVLKSQSDRKLYFYICGFGDIHTEFSSFDVTEIEYTFSYGNDAKLKFKEVEVIGAPDHRLETFAQKVSDKTRLKAMLIAEAIINIVIKFEFIDNRQH